MASPRAELEALLTKEQNQTNAITRMEIFSAHFLDYSYSDHGPLGEGPHGRYDQDPLYRFDTFDCTTFVETIISLAISSSADSFEENMRSIRYADGVIDYLTRNHFPSLQWIPNNIQNGHLQEINDLILNPSERLWAEAQINIPNWLLKLNSSAIQIPFISEAKKQNLLNELHALAPYYIPILARLNYIPIKALLHKPELLINIPHGSLVNFVRPNWDLTESAGTHMNVSHQGLLFWIKDTLYLRHASNSGIKKVADIPFIEYLQRFENHATMKGVHFMALNPTSSR